MRLATPKSTPQGVVTPTAAAPWARKAKAAPRSTMPIRAMLSGTYRATLTAAKAAGNAVKRPVIMAISHTWLASQTGPIASATRRRCSAALGPRARASQTPPPKSAPASTT